MSKLKKYSWPTLAVILLIILLLCRYGENGTFGIAGFDIGERGGLGNWNGHSYEDISTEELLDSDGDTIPDIYEDIDGDGDLADDDTDGDEIPDYLDDDDDGDGIPTETEVTDGEIYGSDVDGDGIPNYLDTDSDGDGLTDEEEGTDDYDGDGIPDYLDDDTVGSFSGSICLSPGECVTITLDIEDAPPELVAVVMRDWEESVCLGGSTESTGGSVKGPSVDIDDIPPKTVLFVLSDSEIVILEEYDEHPGEYVDVTIGYYDGTPWEFTICNFYIYDIEVNWEIHLHTGGSVEGLIPDEIPAFELFSLIIASCVIMLFKKIGEKYEY